MSNTLETLKDIAVEKIKLDRTRLLPDQPLKTLGIDSLQMVDLLFAIEDQFDISFPNVPMEQLNTLAALAAVIDDARLKKAA